MTNELQPYPEYKDSGLPWLGWIPAHWEIERLKWLAYNITDQGPPNDPSMPYIALEHVESWTGRVRRAHAHLVNGIVKRFNQDDVLFGKLRPYLAKVTRPQYSGVCVGEFFVLRRRDPRFRPHYYEHLLRSHKFIGIVDSSTYGAKMPRADWGFVGSVGVPIPPPDEQVVIAHYLDGMDQKVRRFIRNRRRLIEVLNEQKQAIINQYVTGRIDPRTGKPYPHYKPSGIDWLGDIPEHWEVLRLKNVATVVLGKMLKTTPSPGYKLRPYLRSANIQWWEPRLDDVAEMWFSDAEMGIYRLSPGDLLVSEGGEVGRACLWNGQIEECYIQNSVHKVSPNDRVRSQFLLLQFFLLGKSGHFEAITNRVSIGHLTREKLVAVRVAVPAINEQDEIVKVVAESTHTIDTAINRAQCEIDLIREYRTRLIADVVTGKVDVRGLAPAEALPAEEQLDEGIDDEEMLGDNEPELVEEVEE